MSGLGEAIKVRVSRSTKTALERLAKDRGEGVAISDIAREAIKEYLERKESEALVFNEPTAVRYGPRPPGKAQGRRGGAQ